MRLGFRWRDTVARVGLRYSKVDHSKPWYIIHWRGLGDHSAYGDRAEGPFAHGVEALMALGKQFGQAWVDDHWDELTAGPEEGSMAWVHDNWGISLAHTMEDVGYDLAGESIDTPPAG